ncbi:MAG: dockerin type I repeat-containing protein [Ruminococcus sp.]
MKTNKRILSFTLVLCLMLSLVCVSFSALAEEAASEVYKPYFEAYLSDNLKEGEMGLYKELYSHGTASATPDFVLVQMHANMLSPMRSYDVFGDYIVSAGCEYPYTLGYYILTPENGRIYTLREAYDLPVPEVEAIFTEKILGVRLGDINLDGDLNVKDATQVQKCLAGLERFPDYDLQEGLYASQKPNTYLSFYYSDANLDHKRDIKDATAIQKAVAGIE